ncbi:MAG: FHA domain-containing protein [Prevotella sp.]|nr:FHA domain-containing protein [Prevotella sp.]
METIILGRTEGNQPFHLKQTQVAVSGKHAVITIDDYGIWWIEDRWSTNGTSIREDDGRLRLIGNKKQPGKCRITPMTFVILGAGDTSGCCFYAKQVKEFGNFDEDFDFIHNKMEELSSYEKKRERRIKLKSFFLEIALPILIAVAIYCIGKQFEVGNGISLGAGIGGGMLMNIVTRMMRFLYNPQEKKKEMEKLVKAKKKCFSQCPNPECNHILTDPEIELMRCGTCNIQHN